MSGFDFTSTLNTNDLDLILGFESYKIKDGCDQTGQARTWLRSEERLLRSRDGMTLVWSAPITDLNAKTSHIYSQREKFMNSYCAESQLLRILFEVFKKSKLEDHIILIWVSIAEC
jgi:hypothetical protein